MHDQHDHLPQFSADAFAQQVDEMFAAAEERAKPALARGCTDVRAPITGLKYDPWFGHEVEQAKRWARAALAAAARFRQENPTWPPLPLRDDEVGRLPKTPPARTILLHGYAISQKYHRWPLQHPCFRDYARSALADRYSSPDRVRFDPTLRQEFPPAPSITLFPWNGREGAMFLVWVLGR
jgi:hypothetical protein